MKTTQEFYVPKGAIWFEWVSGAVIRGP